MSDIVHRLRLSNGVMLDAEREECAAEIERLRQEVKLREQMCTDATLYAKRLQEADDEIERLRGIISDTLTIAEKWPGDPLRSIIQPVREALGE